jgi:putative acyl-CoA dehydrogenase
VEALLASRDYEPELRPLAEKGGALVGMALTERQEGPDVPANETRAEPGADDGHAITGEKWFCSAPMCDGFLSSPRRRAGSRASSFRGASPTARATPSTPAD